MTIESTDITICRDCDDYLNDNVDVIEFHHCENYHNVVDRVEAGIARLNFDSISPDSTVFSEFSIEPCQCCGSTLAGERVKAILHISKIRKEFIELQNENLNKISPWWIK